jgi:hypothetical protein
MDTDRIEEWIETMVRAVGALNIPRTRDGIRPIRVHSAGDFFSPKYAAAWLEVANRVWDLEIEYGRGMPEIRFWAPTRTWAARGFNWEKLADGLKNPNFIVRPSSYHVDDPAPEAVANGWPRGATSVINNHNQGMRSEHRQVLEPLAEEGERRLIELRKLPMPAEEKARKAHLKQIAAATSLTLFKKVEDGRKRDAADFDERFDWTCQTYATHGSEDLAPSCHDAAGPDGQQGCRACWTRPDLRINYTTH